jgi:hypothetical protein
MPFPTGTFGTEIKGRGSRLKRLFVRRKSTRLGDRPTDDLSGSSGLHSSVFRIQGPRTAQDASINCRVPWRNPRVSSAQRKTALGARALKYNPACPAAKLDSGPAQKVNNESNDENRSN